ncbi:hypothetical protein [Xanthomonas sacchari]|nr:hypothetical protein [Xanthomonas sacchari]
MVAPAAPPAPAPPPQAFAADSNASAAEQQAAPTGMPLRAPTRAETAQDALARNAPADTATPSRLATSARAKAAANETSDTLSLRPSTSAAAPAAALPESDSNALAAALEADAQLSPRRWLQRIRERRDQGELDTARASLLRFQRAHPQRSIPQDLRPLLPD